MKTIKLNFILCVTIILVVVASLFNQTVVKSSTLIQRVEIVDVDWSAFPDIHLKVNFLDGAGQPVTQLSPENLVVSEDGVNVPFTYQPTLRGLKVVLVLDEALGLEYPGLTGATLADEMKYAAQRIVDTMQPSDEMEIMFVRGDRASTSRSFSENRDEVMAEVSNWVYKRSGVYSFGLVGAGTALDHLTSAYSSKDPCLVVFLSPGIQINKPGFSPENVADKAAAAGIPVHTIVFQKESLAIQSISQKSGGTSILYTSNDQLEALLTNINNYRKQYTLSYRSTSQSISERVISVVADPNSAIGAQDNVTLTINPAPQSPLIVSIKVNDENPIRRVAAQSSDDMQSIPLTEAIVVAEVAWPDGYPPRKLVANKLSVNGAEFSTNQLDASGNLMYTWDLRSFIMPGTTTVQLQIYLKDELGFETTDTKTVTVDVIVENPGNPVCEALVKIPKVGESLSNTCYRLGIGPSQILNTALGIISLVLVILLWFNRKTVVKVGMQTGAAVTQMIKGLTQRYGANKAKARLELVTGGKEGQTAQYDLHGETPIGRDVEHAELIFDYPTISRSHCIIHLDKSSGKWLIEDRDSANGTFLNDVKLEPFTEMDLKDGDMIQLSRLERGGLKFRFTILADNPDKKSSGGGGKEPPVDEDDTVEDVNEDEEIRVTHRVKRDRQTQRSIGRRAREDDDFDPSNPVF